MGVLARPIRRRGVEVMSLVRLVYKSSPNFVVDGSVVEREIRAILEVARARNARGGITGGLLFTQRYFFQILEGEDAEIDVLFKKIAADPRHKSVAVLSRDVIKRRRFYAWAMAHVRMRSQEFDLLDRLLADPGELDDGKLKTLTALMSEVATSNRAISVKPMMLYHAV